MIYMTVLLFLVLRAGWNMNFTASCYCLEDMEMRFIFQHFWSCNVWSPPLHMRSAFANFLAVPYISFKTVVVCVIWLSSDIHRTSPRNYLGCFVWRNLVVPSNDHAREYASRILRFGQLRCDLWVFHLVDVWCGRPGLLIVQEQGRLLPHLLVFLSVIVCYICTFCYP